MIDHLNNVLRHLFMAQINQITDEAQVRFQPPDRDWRTYVSNFTVNGLPLNLLNVYLFDLRENRKLRSNARERKPQNGMITETPAPRRIDCHYLITAWSPALVTPHVEPTLDEQALLYEVTGVLMNNEPLIPRQVYAPDPLPSDFPGEIAEKELPITILPPEGFPKLAEFWGAMGRGARWKPAVYLIVTLPVILRAEDAGPMITAKTTHYSQIGALYSLQVHPPLIHNYRQGTTLLRTTVTPGTKLQDASSAGAMRITVADTNGLNDGDVLMIDSGSTTEFCQLGALPQMGTSIPIVQPLRYRHEAETPLHRVTAAAAVGRLGAIAPQGGQTLEVERATVDQLSVGKVLKVNDQTHTDYVQVTSIGGSRPALSTAADTIVQIGGQVAVAGVPDATLVGAKVTLVELKLTASTDTKGRFTFANLSPGSYCLRAEAEGYVPAEKMIQVPGAKGEYDFDLEPNV